MQLKTAIYFAAVVPNAISAMCFFLRKLIQHWLGIDCGIPQAYTRTALCDATASRMGGSNCSNLVPRVELAAESV